MNALFFLCLLLPIQVFSETALLPLFRSKRETDEEEPEYWEEDAEDNEEEQGDAEEGEAGEEGALFFNSVIETRTAADYLRKVKLSGTLETGHILRIRGVFLHNAHWTAVNLLDESDEQILHIAFHFNQGVLGISSQKGHSMGAEGAPLPYKPGNSFSIRLRVTEKGYEIWCDDKMVHVYQHRFPFDQVKYMEITGDNIVYVVEWFGDIDLPFEGDIAGGTLKLNHYCEVEGIPRGSFSVELLGENGDILFHFNPRFDGKKSQIVRSSHIDGSWNNEERGGEFPFEIGRGFILRLQNEYRDIQFFVDGKYIGRFKHRTDNPDNDYVKIAVSGNVDMIEILCPD